MVIKFYGLAILFRQQKLTEFNFTEAHVIEARFNTQASFNTCARAENGIDRYIF